MACNPCTFTKLSDFRKFGLPIAISYLLPLEEVVIGAQIARALGGSESSLERTIIGRTFPAIPKSTR
jgi:hypothetical protein